MAKSDTPFNELHLSKAYTPPHTPTYAGDTPINGFDTETADGDIFMVSIAWEGFGGVVKSSKDIMNPKDLWEILTHKRARSSLNVWYNLDFDANSLLKHLLEPKDLAILTTTGTVEKDGYEVTYIPSKFLRIKDPNRNICTHYDAAQFFFTTLEKAATEWLKQEKLSETIDVTKFGKAGGRVNEYILENWDTIKTYARKDAVLVRDLWAEATRVAEDLNIPMGRPFSTGYLAESYLNARLKEKPGLGVKEVAQMGWEAYHGGRFEVLKRGDIGPVAGPDINSAYPWVLSNLPDPKTLQWEQVSSPSLSEIRGADYGFIEATVTTDSARPIQPFAVKGDFSKLKYPALSNYRITCLKEIFTNAHKYDYLIDYEIHNCWLGYETSGTYYPFDFIEPLYKDRKEAEDNGYLKRGLFLKIVLNSMYGKMCQTTPKRRKIEGETELEDNQQFVPAASLPESIREEYENGFIEWLEVGSYFNPFLASYITGMTRLELHKRVLEYGLEDNTVMLATDSMMVERDPFERSGFASDLVKDGLGNWDYDYQGTAFVVGAGIYQIDFDGGGRKVKTRGFKEAQLDKGLRYAAEKANGKVKVETDRPLTVAEAMWSNEAVSDVGNFRKQERDLNPDMDDKRQWEAPATFNRLLSDKQESKPLLVRG